MVTYSVFTPYLGDQVNMILSYHRYMSYVLDPIAFRDFRRKLRRAISFFEHTKTITFSDQNVSSQIDKSLSKLIKVWVNYATFFRCNWLGGLIIIFILEISKSSPASLLNGFWTRFHEIRWKGICMKYKQTLGICA